MSTPALRPANTVPPGAPGSWKSRLWTILGTLMFGGMLVGAGLWTVPNLVTDWRIREVARPAIGGRVSQGRCTSKLIFHICDATLSVETKTGRVSRSVNYVFTDFHLGDYSVEVMADPSQPELATTDMALDKLWNRTVTLVVGCALLLFFVFGAVAALFKGARGRAGARATDG